MRCKDLKTWNVLTEQLSLLTCALGGQVDGGSFRSVSPISLASDSQVNKVASVGLQACQRIATLLLAEGVVHYTGHSDIFRGTTHVHVVPQDFRVAWVPTFWVPLAPLDGGVVGGNGAMNDARWRKQAG